MGEARDPAGGCVGVHPGGMKRLVSGAFRVAARRRFPRGAAMSTPTMPPREPTTARRWSARLALVAFAAAVVLLLAGAGTQTLRLLLLIAAGCALVLVGVWLFASRRGAMRLLGAALAVGSVIAMLAIEASHDLLWVTFGCIALLVASLAAARSALRTVAVIPERDERSGPPPSHAFLIMNPRSGGGKVDRFHLREEAERLGAEVALLDTTGTTDVAALARQAIEDGADLLGVPGGDGPQALVAGPAAEHDAPLLVIPAGTRNHFALDLGLDRDDPAQSLEALTDGVEIRVDLGRVGGRAFVNNASFGAYAEVVQSPAYRDDKVGTLLRLLPDVLTHQ